MECLLWTCILFEILTHRAQGLSDSQLLNMMCGLAHTYAQKLIDQTDDTMTHSDNLDSSREQFDRV